MFPMFWSCIFPSPFTPSSPFFLPFFCKSLLRTHCAHLRLGTEPCHQRANSCPRSLQELSSNPHFRAVSIPSALTSHVSTMDAGLNNCRVGVITCSLPRNPALFLQLNHKLSMNRKPHCLWLSHGP
jgi:hypothetical protein